MKAGQKALKSLIPPELLAECKEMQLGRGESIKEYWLYLEAEKRAVRDGAWEASIGTSLMKTKPTSRTAEQRWDVIKQLTEIQAELDAQMMPYEKPKLAATQVTGDANNPLALLQVELVGEAGDET